MVTPPCTTQPLLHANRAQIARQLQCDFGNFEVRSWILGFLWRAHAVIARDCECVRVGDPVRDWTVGSVHMKACLWVSPCVGSWHVCAPVCACGWACAWLDRWHVCTWRRYGWVRSWTVGTCAHEDVLMGESGRGQLARVHMKACLWVSPGVGVHLVRVCLSACGWVCAWLDSSRHFFCSCFNC
jgi:hypothetical protein